MLYHITENNKRSMEREELIKLIMQRIYTRRIYAEGLADDILRLFNVSGSLPIEEVALHASDDWFDNAKFRSDVRADLKSYYEGYRDAMRFCRGNDR